ncbi:MAG: hypothetical protein DMG65_26415 [Candidatus Angelobacter sp. Gp1-AA117]|nr:MAG: hypothetical protein DMG65_26415 [Candidatus Angelobacter sp. Gp1-AA117]
MHRLFKSFPFRADVLLLDTDGIESPLKEGRYAAAIRYNISPTSSYHVIFHGIIPLSDIAPYEALLKSVLHIESEDAKSSLMSLSLRSIYARPHFVHIVRNDPRNSPALYAADLALHLPDLKDIFSSRTDFNTRYNLQPDPILDESILLEISRAAAGFFPYTRKDAIQRIQEDVSNIQLISHIPEHVHRAFLIAKRLYIFGLFEYHFFTVSAHYCYLAVESAIYHRWNLALPNPTVLQYGSDSLSVPKTGRRSIEMICKQRGWNKSKTLVNGRPYPGRVGQVLYQLHQDKIVSDWQHRRLRDVWMKLRNYHSHLEFVSITGPTDTLERAAEVINTLFDSVKP